MIISGSLAIGILNYDLSCHCFYSYRVVETVPHNSCFLTMENLIPDTDYQVSMNSFSKGSRRRSNTLTVKTPSNLYLNTLNSLLRHLVIQLSVYQVHLDPNTK